MGLSFHYKGALKNPQSLKSMIEEVVDIASTNEWKYLIYGDEFPENSFSSDDKNDSLCGIIITPPDCEPVCLTFFSDGKLVNGIHLKLPHPEKQHEDVYLSVKTQFAGAAIHIQLITLFEYLNKKYFENFDLYDEGNFWETKNEQLLKETFAKYNNLIEGFDSLLSAIPMKDEETIEAYLLRIAAMNGKRNEGN